MPGISNTEAGKMKWLLSLVSTGEETSLCSCLSELQSHYIVRGRESTVLEKPVKKAHMRVWNLAILGWQGWRTVPRLQTRWCASPSF